MKYCFTAIIFFLYSCNDPSGPPKLTDKLKEQVSNKIKSTLKAPQSYAPLEWTEPDTLYRDAIEYPEYARLKYIYDSIVKVTDSVRESKVFNPQLYDTLNNMREDIFEREMNWLTNAPRDIAGWRVNHKFKSLDSAGLAEFYTFQIRFDQEMNIKEVEDISKLVK